MNSKNSICEDPYPGKPCQLGESVVRDAVQRFADLFSSLTEEDVVERTASVYSEDAYLNDTLKEVTGLEAIGAYLKESGKAVRSCRVAVDDLARSGSDYYLRWTMEIRFRKLEGGRPCRSRGISHIRFNDEGKINYHQDYWDSASALFEHIPVIGALIRYVKRRL